MKYKINTLSVKNSWTKFFSLNSKYYLTLKRFLLISIIFLSLLFIFNPNFTTKINKQIENDLIKNKRDLKTSNPGDDFFKFTYGLWLEHNYWELDPHNAWGGSDSIVIDQVCEGLFRYNLSDPNLAIVPNLANGTGTWSSDNLNYTVSLLNNVTFHDGTKFNATAVKVSFDRLAYFMNSTGKMTPQNITTINWLYRWKDYTPFINRTEIINETAIKFVLNRPFAGLLGLLCSPGSYILSPASTNPNQYINGSAMDDLVGTGPFIYDRYIPNNEVRFHAYENYSRGKAQIELLRFSIIPASNQNQTLIDGQVDLIGAPSHDMLNTLESDPNINVIKDWSNVFYYLGMNNKLLNKTWRQAISYSINYSYIIENIISTPSKRPNSPLADGIIYSNNTNQVVELNITKARELMQSMGFGIGLNTTYPGIHESNWTSAHFAKDGLGSPIDLNLFNFSGTPHPTNQLLNNFLINNLSKIGIDLNETDRDWGPFLDTGSNNPDDLGLWFVGWGPDLNDPYTVINELYSNSSIGTNNYGQVNDTTLQNLMDNAMNETDSTARKTIYNNI